MNTPLPLVAPTPSVWLAPARAQLVLGAATLGKVLYVVLMVGLLAAGTLNRAERFRLVPDPPLAGIDAAPPWPTPTLESIWNERFQPAVSDWLQRTWGLRGFAVRSDSTLQILAFHESRPRSYTVLGERGILFSWDDVAYASRDDDEQTAATIAAAEHFARVQRTLAARGTSLVPLVVPAKTTLFPGDLPPRVKHSRHRGTPAPTLYATFVDTLRARGASFVDARALVLSDLRDPLDVFPRAGRHWRPAAACRALRFVLLSSVADDPVDCGAPTDEETNLDGFLNTWSPVDGDAPAFPKAAPSPERLRVPTLYVGSSFLYNVIRAARMLDVLQPSIFYFYDEHVIDTTTERVLGRVQADTDAWRRETFSKRVIVVDVLESQLPATNERFLTEIERGLDP
jgi:hypothetical protein